MGIFTSFTLLLIVQKVGIIGFGVNITLVAKVIFAMFKRKVGLKSDIWKQNYVVIVLHPKYFLIKAMIIFSIYLLLGFKK